ncbi:MAG: hypothetical protein A3H96_19320 [Acidobacteria bacterium RIFCSPLOWO2_02_FULL_67_36]|nr:MAG: hypothetical protein A3H96_19320 [Acidobacteria bacterium RIFCSPLOWO2_02_FULL_67_36]OFW25271.1 MAG: hypothetical protein A3G21_19845 [Acidobacteria bacterium RIFCSPLOWO2_12_FULL_66_21]
MHDAERVRADFDEIARLAGPRGSGSDRCDRFLASLVPAGTVRVLDVGCGLGGLAFAIASDGREVVGIDLSPVMIERARRAENAPGVSFICGNFLEAELAEASFDCVVSAAVLHHMPYDMAIARMAALLRPGGRLIVQDLRRDSSLRETLRSCSALAHTLLICLVRTGRLRSSRRVREAWARHGAGETYLSFDEARALADRILPGARVLDHALWRYTILWDKPAAP